MSEREQRHEWTTLAIGKSTEIPHAVWREPGGIVDWNGGMETMADEILRLASALSRLTAERDEAMTIATELGCVCQNSNDLCPTCDALEKMAARIATRQGGAG